MGQIVKLIGLIARLD
jgi:hypothetical protein